MVEDVDPSRGSEFADADIARHGAYRGAGYLGFLLHTAVELSVLILLARWVFPLVVTRVSTWPGGWPVRAAVLAVVLAAILAIALLPLGYVRGFAMEHAWGLSTQTFGGWLLDQAKGLLVGGVIAAITATAFFGLVRWQPRSWWLVGWVVFTLLTAVLTYLWPVVIAPLFNRFEPLNDPVAVARYEQLAEKAGVEVDEVLVADASRRTRAENAYVAGLGNTKQIVLYDTLLESGDVDHAEFIVAHELGHEVEGHVFKGLLISSLGLLGAFAALRWLSSQRWLWEWAGAEGIADFRALPVLLVFAIVATLLVAPAANLVSRRFESRADEIAVRLTGDRDAAVRSFRVLAFRNLADLRPPAVVVGLLYTHPPIPERIDALVAE